MKAIEHIHFACYALCKQSVGKYLPVAGTIGIFCHYNEEYESLTQLQETLVDFSNSVNGKYFRLLNPIVISAKKDIPKAVYTHFYIRKPDPYRYQVGDADYFLETEKYFQLKQSLISGTAIKGARIVPNRPDFDYVELYDPDIDACGYVSDKKYW
jgi:hypothetical protein